MARFFQFGFPRAETSGKSLQTLASAILAFKSSSALRKSDIEGFFSPAGFFSGRLHLIVRHNAESSGHDRMSSRRRARGPSKSLTALANQKKLREKQFCPANTSVRSLT